ncbi:MAG: ATP-binding cassette domain-containing protein [Defluviitaleaceae bacterium]|nr:ATP-binding cassette domain-containing protein [Defluviitaleaceae bacterium]
MIIKNKTLKNNRIQISNINLDFSQKGVYIISGENGVGKTTLLESLLYELNNGLSFVNEAHQKAYDQSKQSLFAYLPQNIAAPKLRIEDYLIETHSEESATLSHYFKAFELNVNVLKTKFSDLSGGEQVKIAFINTLLKNTPYIFLDEPTNNLDDTSTLQLKKMIESFKNERTFIIITHDSRLLALEATQIELTKEDVKIIKENSSTTHLNDKEIKRIPFSPFKMTKSSFFHPLNIFVLIFYLLIIYATFILNQLFIEPNYGNIPLPDEDIIFVSSGWEWFFEETNWRVSESLNLTIDIVDQAPFVPFSSILDIAEMHGVSDIILSDSTYWRDIHHLIYRNELLSDVVIVNPPDMIWGGYTIGHELLRHDFLQEGRFPKDNEREVVLSEALLRTHFGFNENEIENAIGAVVDLNQINHTIVGIYGIDLSIISHHTSENFGFYTFSKETFDGFLSSFTDEGIGINDMLTYPLQPIFIVTMPGEEAQLLTELLTQFPNGEFFSSTYASAWTMSLNRETMGVLYRRGFLQMGAIGIFGLLFASEFHKALKEKFNYLEVYYLDKRRIRWAFFMWHFIGYVSILSICLVLMFITPYVVNHIFNDHVFNQFFRRLAPLTTLGVGLVSLPSFIYLYIKSL